MTLQAEEVKEVFAQWKHAMMNNDLNFLDQLFSENFEATNTAGKTKNKREELQWLQIRNILYRCWQDHEVSINVCGSNATVKSKQILKVIIYDMPVKIAQQVFLQFTNKDGKWQLQHYKENALEF